MAYCIKCGLKGYHLELQCNSNKFFLFPPKEKRALSQDSVIDQIPLSSKSAGTLQVEIKSEHMNQENQQQRCQNASRSLSPLRSNSKYSKLICDTKLKNILEKYLPDENNEKKNNQNQQISSTRQETKDIISRFMNEKE